MTRNSKSKRLVIVLLVFALYQFQSFAQIAFVKAKDANYSDVDYKVEWGYPTLAESEKAAAAFLKSMGYSQTSAPAVEGANIPSGFYVVIKSHYIDYKGKDHYSMGMGVSPLSIEDAEIEAVQNIAEHDWSWTRTMGYLISVKGEFRTNGNAEGPEFVYIIHKDKKGSCMVNATSYTCMSGDFKSAVYDNLIAGLKGNAIKNGLPSPEIGKFRITKRYVAVLKCLQICPPENLPYSKFKFVPVNSQADLFTIATLGKGQVSSANGEGYFLEEWIDLQSQAPSDGTAEDFISYARRILKESMPLRALEEMAKKVKMVAFGGRW